MSDQERGVGDSTDRITWYRRRVKVLEDLLSCYRIGRTPSERVFVELDETRKHIDSNGAWRTDAP